MTMRIAAIICEYNPFHNGHAWHIAQTRAAGYDKIVCIMDGHLTQRGQFSALSKWSRARAALMNGADAVVELPALFACRSADVFARSGVALAHAVGADALSFGSECADISLIREMAAMEEDDVFRAALAEGLRQGQSQPRARAAAMQAAMGRSDIPTGPNAILATEYLRALNAIGDGAPEALVIHRAQDYHSLETGPMASASALRAAAERGDMADVCKGLPENARYQADEMQMRHVMHDMYLNALRMLGPEGIKKLPDVSEGLENRIYQAAREAASLDDMLMSAKCKRYTHARLMRLATHALTGLTGEMAGRNKAPGYIRVLGASDGGIISEISRRARLPMFSISQMRGDEVFGYEERTTELWALTRNDPAERRAGQEYTRKFVRP